MSKVISDKLRCPHCGGHLKIANHRIKELQKQVENAEKDGWLRTAYRQEQRAIKAETKVAELEAKIQKVVDNAKPVRATNYNTPSVQSGHELSGYIKHYIVPTYVITAIKGESDG